MSQHTAQPASGCRWGYITAIKNVGIVMLILIVIGMIGSLVSGGLGSVIVNGFASSLFFIPILFMLIPTIIIVSAIYNLGACGSL